MTTTNNWIKMSERKPTDADLPVLFWRNEWARGASPIYTNSLAEALKHDLWLKIDIPAPPKEPTQRVRDAQAYVAWYHGVPTSGLSDAPYAWHAALAWERAEIAKLISETIPATWSKELSYYIPNSIIEKLRARLRP